MGEEQAREPVADAARALAVLGQQAQQRLGLGLEQGPQGECGFALGHGGGAGQHFCQGLRGAAGQVAKLADDLVETSEQNRELIVGLVRTEVDRAAGRMGFVREEELAAVRRHVSRLESSLAEVRAQMGSAAVPAEAPAAADAPVSRAEAPGAEAPRPRKKKVVVAPEDGAE